MEKSVKSSMDPEAVWTFWEKAYQLHEEGDLQEGGHSDTTKRKPLRFQVVSVEKGKGFSLLWKSLWISLVFSHEVRPLEQGSQITYRILVKGLLAWPIRLLLKKKMEENLAKVLSPFL